LRDSLPRRSVPEAAKGGFIATMGVSVGAGQARITPLDPATDADVTAPDVDRRLRTRVRMKVVLQLSRRWDW